MSWAEGKDAAARRHVTLNQRFSSLVRVDLLSDPLIWLNRFVSQQSNQETKSERKLVTCHFCRYQRTGTCALHARAGEHNGSPRGNFSRGEENRKFVTTPIYRHGLMLTRSCPLARSLCDLRSDGAERIPFAISKMARVFVTASIFKKRKCRRQGTEKESKSDI
jgi:hypothetical protein